MKMKKSNRWNHFSYIVFNLIGLISFAFSSGFAIYYGFIYKREEYVLFFAGTAIVLIMLIISGIFVYRAGMKERLQAEEVREQMQNMKAEMEKLVTQNEKQENDIRWKAAVLNNMVLCQDLVQIKMRHFS